MPYQNINVTLTPTQVADIKNAFNAVQALMPWLVALSDVERQSLFKTGAARLSFVQDARTGAVDNPTILPASFDAAGFGKDVDLFATLTDLTMVAKGLTRKLDDTRLAVGSEAAKEASQVRGYVDNAAKTTPGLQPLSAKLAESFKRQGSPKPTVPPA